MRQRERRKILSSTLFIKAIEGAKNELAEQQAFLESAIENPALLFSQCHEKLGKKSLTFHIMNTALYDDGKIQVHDFQTFLADLTNLFVQEWVKEQGITEIITVEVRTPNTYPSIFAIYHDDVELIQFSIVGKYYGVRDKAKSETEIRVDYEQRAKSAEETIKPLLERVKNYEFMLEHPHQYVRDYYRAKWGGNQVVIQGGKSKRSLSFKKRLKLPISEIMEHVTILFKKRDMIEKLGEVLKNTERMIESERESLSRFPSVDSFIERNHQQKAITEKLIPLFTEYGYRLETEKYSLY